jgi:DNA-binding MarR family transcriptional regulator
MDRASPIRRGWVEHADEDTCMKTKEIYRQPGHLIRRAHQIATAVFTNEAKAFDLTAVQFSALVAIQDQPGIDATRLSDVIYFDRATIGNVLERLEKKGLIERKAGVEDRRTKRVYLTPQGRHMIGTVARKVPQIGERILAPLAAKDRARFIELLIALTGAKDANGAGGTP